MRKINVLGIIKKKTQDLWLNLLTFDNFKHLKRADQKTNKLIQNKTHINLMTLNSEIFLDWMMNDPQIMVAILFIRFGIINLC